MADLNRPDYGQVWASTGEKVAPDTVKMQSGWVQEMMPFQYENYLQARQDEAIVYLLQKGVPEYSSAQEYIASKSVVVYQGNLYMATATVTNVLPTVTGSWKRLNPSLLASGAVPVSSGGTGATTASEARTNLGLGSIATSVAPSTNGIVVKDANDSLVARTITGTSGNIVITNPDGVAGNINVNVGSNVAQLSQDSSWTSKGGIRLPSGSTGERGLEVAGKIRYNTTLQKFEGFDGVSWNALGASSNIEITTLSGNGATTTFTLNSDVFSAVATDVYIGGIYQNKASYSVSGSTITFSEAPVAGVDNIQVLSRRVVDLGLSAATQISIQDTTNLYTSSTVEGALREVGDKVKFVKNAILSFPDYAAASAAAATLSDGQVVGIESDETRDGLRTLYVVQSGALVFERYTEAASDGFDFQRNYAVGTLGRAIAERSVSPTDFPWLAKFDGVTDDGTAIQSCLDWAKSAYGVKVVLPAGTAISSIGIVQPDFLTVEGMGRGDEEYFDSAPTKIIFKGTGAKSYSCPGIVSRSIANPDAGAAYLSDSGTRGDSYALVDYSTPFSAAWVIGKGCATKGFAIFPNHAGVQGYISDSSGALSDEWDVGFFMRNAGAAHVESVTAAGHWRKAGALDATYKITGDSRTIASERKLVIDCYFSGFKGLSVRGTNPIVDTSYGYGGTRYVKCFLRDLNHKSGRLATSSFLSTPFPFPSGALEIDGATMRGISFVDCTLMARDDQIVTFGDCQEIMFTGSYWEAKNAIVSGAWLTTLGVRAVRIPGSGTTSIYCFTHSKYGVDASPMFTRESAVTKYTADGVFNPNRASDDDYETPRNQTTTGRRLRSVDTDFVIWKADGTTRAMSLSKAGVMTILERDYQTLSDQMRLRVTRSGVLTSWMYTLSSGTIYAGGQFNPATDNAFSNGSAGNRWTEIRAVNGAIVTSDEREKSSPAEIEDGLLDAWAECRPYAWQWLDSINKKGESARTHYGPIAQRIRDALVKHGLMESGSTDCRHGLLCYDEWEYKPAVYDDEGFEIEAAVEAGNRWGVRSDQCLWIEAAYQRRRADRIESRLDLIETQLGLT